MNQSVLAITHGRPLTGLGQIRGGEGVSSWRGSREQSMVFGGENIARKTAASLLLRMHVNVVEDAIQQSSGEGTAVRGFQG